MKLQSCKFGSPVRIGKTTYPSIHLKDQAKITCVVEDRIHYHFFHADCPNESFYTTNANVQEAVFTLEAGDLDRIMGKVAKPEQTVDEETAMTEELAKPKTWSRKKKVIDESI